MSGKPKPRHTVVQPLDQSYRLIPLTQGQNAVVDAEDFARLSAFNWQAHWDPKARSYRPIRSVRLSPVKTKTIYMHKEIFGVVRKKEVDHKNRDTLDNRKSNLRPCTHLQNMANQGRKRHSESKFKGVYIRQSGRWAATLLVKGKRRWIGTFDSAEEAARAYDAAASRYKGEFAHLNFLAQDKSRGLLADPGPTETS